jgi:hypothetical protein
LEEAIEEFDMQDTLALESFSSIAVDSEETVEAAQRLRAEFEEDFGEFDMRDTLALESFSSINVDSEGSWLPEIGLYWWYMHSDEILSSGTSERVESGLVSFAQWGFQECFCGILGFLLRPMGLLRGLLRGTAVAREGCVSTRLMHSGGFLVLSTSPKGWHLGWSFAAQWGFWEGFLTVSELSMLFWTCNRFPRLMNDEILYTLWCWIEYQYHGKGM